MLQPEKACWRLEKTWECRSEEYAPVLNSTNWEAQDNMCGSFSRGTAWLSRSVFKLGERAMRLSRFDKLISGPKQKMLSDTSELQPWGKWVSQSLLSFLPSLVQSDFCSGSKSMGSKALTRQQDQDFEMVIWGGNQVQGVISDNNSL